MDKKIQLTDKVVRALKLRQHKSKEGQFVPYRVHNLSGPQGFHIYVSANGNKAWTLAYRWEGRKRFLKLGSYPATTLTEARKWAFTTWGKSTPLYQVSTKLEQDHEADIQKQPIRRNLFGLSTNAPFERAARFRNTNRSKTQFRHLSESDKSLQAPLDNAP